MDSRQLYEAAKQSGFEEITLESCESLNGLEQVIDMVNFPNPQIIEAMMAGMRSINKKLVSERIESIEPKEL